MAKCSDRMPASGQKRKSSCLKLLGCGHSPKIGSSGVLSAQVDRYTAAGIARTTPTSPVDFYELEIMIENGSHSGCAVVANSDQTVNGASAHALDIVPYVFSLRCYANTERASCL